MNAPQSPGVFEFEAAEIQKLWFATQKRAWSSLVVLPATPGFSLAPLAEALARAGETCLEGGVHLMLAEGADVNSAPRRVAQMAAHVSRGHRVIVAVDAIVQNAAGLPVLWAADACLLGVQLGQSPFAQVSHTLEQVGPSRLVGAVTIKNP